MRALCPCQALIPVSLPPRFSTSLQFTESGNLILSANSRTRMTPFVICRRRCRVSLNSPIEHSSYFRSLPGIGAKFRPFRERGSVLLVLRLLSH